MIWTMTTIIMVRHKIQDIRCPEEFLIIENK